MNCITCLCIGNKYDDVYVTTLQSMVASNITRPYDFVCFSDRLIDGVDVVLIDDPDRYDPVWYKLWILQHERLHCYEKKVFFDLDIVIQNNIDWVFDIEYPGLSVIEAEWKPSCIKNIPGNTGYNSSIMAWSNAAYVWDQFNTRPDYFMIKYKGIDRFLWNEDTPVGHIPAGAVYSYREGASTDDSERFKYRPDYSVCIFNQYPKQHNVLSYEPTKSFWK